MQGRTRTLAGEEALTWQALEARLQEVVAEEAALQAEKRRLRDELYRRFRLAGSEGYLDPNVTKSLLRSNKELLEGAFAGLDAVEDYTGGLGTANADSRVVCLFARIVRLHAARKKKLQRASPCGLYAQRTVPLLVRIARCSCALCVWVGMHVARVKGRTALLCPLVDTALEHTRCTHAAHTQHTRSTHAARTQHTRSTHAAHVQHMQ